MTGELLLCLSLAASASAEVTIPVVGRPTPFINAAGSPMTATASVSTTVPAVDDPIIYTLTLGGLLNPADVTRPTLPEFDADFRITDDGEGSATATSRTFRYTLLPRRPTVATIPVVAIHYYDPRIKQPTDQPKLPFRIARTEPITIHIRKAEEPTRVPVPLEVPPFAERFVEDTSGVAPALWTLAIVGPPFVAIVICAIGWYSRPAGQRLLRRRRSRAARIALAKLENAEPEAIVAAVGRYFVDRFDLPGVPDTAHAVDDVLTRADVERPIRDRAIAFLHLADAARFAPSSFVANDLSEAASALIRHIEDAE